MCQIWLRSDGRLEKKGGTDTHRKTDKETLQLYIVEYIDIIVPATAAYGSVSIALAPYSGYGIYHMTDCRINSPATTGYGSVSIGVGIIL